MSDLRSHDRLDINRSLTVAGLAVLVLGIVSLLVVARHLLMIVFGAALIAVAFNRLARYVSKLFPWDVPRKYRVALLILVAIGVLAACGFGFANSMGEQVVKLTDRVDQSASRVIEAAKEQPIIERIREEFSLSAVLPSSGKSLGLARTLFASTFGAVTDLLILAILAVYLSVSPDAYRSGMIRVLPVGWRLKAAELLTEISNTLWHWILGRGLAMSIVGVCFGTGLAVLGIPMPLELGIFAGLVTFVPNLGGIAAVVPALLLASSQSQSAVAGVLVLYILIQFAESYLITPLVQQRQVNVPPAMVILAQVICGIVFGLWGIMFATPLIAILLLITRRLYVEDFLEAAQEDG